MPAMMMEAIEIPLFMPFFIAIPKRILQQHRVADRIWKLIL